MPTTSTSRVAAALKPVVRDAFLRYGIGWSSALQTKAQRVAAIDRAYEALVLPAFDDVEVSSAYLLIAVGRMTERLGVTLVSWGPKVLGIKFREVLGS